MLSFVGRRALSIAEKLAAKISKKYQDSLSFARGGHCRGIVSDWQGGEAELTSGI